MLIHAILEGGATDDTKHLTVHVVFDIGTVPSNLQSKMYSFIDLFMFVKSYLLGGFFLLFIPMQKARMFKTNDMCCKYKYITENEYFLLNSFKPQFSDI